MGTKRQMRYTRGSALAVVVLDVLSRAARVPALPFGFNIASGREDQRRIGSIRRR